MLCFVKINSILFNPLCVWILFIRVSLFSGSCSSSWYWTSVTGTSRLLFMGVSAVAVLTVMLPYPDDSISCAVDLQWPVHQDCCLWESVLWLYWLFMGVSTIDVLTIMLPYLDDSISCAVDLQWPAVWGQSHQVTTIQRQSDWPWSPVCCHFALQSVADHVKHLYKEHTQLATLQCNLLDNSHLATYWY